MRRFTFRTDGFVSLHALGSGELLSKPLRFSGRSLEINYRTAACGNIRVEIQDGDGKPVRKFSLANCQPITGEHIAHTVAWKSGARVNALADKSVKLRFVLNDADLFSLKFNP